MHIRGFFLGCALAAGLAAIPVPMPGQPFNVVHAFASLSNGTNSDGTLPYPALSWSGHTLYGTTFNGGAASNGTVFAVNTDGTGFTNLHTFTQRYGVFRTNTDGAQPVAGVILSGNKLYGTTGIGGTAGRGTIYVVNTDGSGFTNLHNFSGNNDGSATTAGLVLSGNRLYGAAQSGGANGLGMLFALNTDGSGYTNLHSFAGLSGNINSEGAQPLGTLTLSGSNLFGTTWNGGTGGEGAVFRINADGTGFTNLHSFSALVAGTNGDGAVLFNGLALSGNIVFGTTRIGGAFGSGTLFRINTDGSGFTNFHNFGALSNNTNSDGANPYGALFVSGTTLYGTAAVGGSSSNGTVFVVNMDGTGFKVLYNFTALINGTNNDGAAPASGVLSSNTLYGVAHVGGSGGNGTVFSLFVPPPLDIGFSGKNVILTWPTNADGFTLQSAPDLTPPAAWSAATPAPAVVDGRNAVTNSLSGGQMFYRLAR